MNVVGNIFKESDCIENMNFRIAYFCFQVSLRRLLINSDMGRLPYLLCKKILVHNITILRDEYYFALAAAYFDEQRIQQYTPYILT